MKKLLSIILLLTLETALTACGGTTIKETEYNNDELYIETSSDVENSAENNEEASFQTSSVAPSEDTSEAFSETLPETSSEENSQTSAEDTSKAPAETSCDSQWKQFLKEYEDWIDEYIEIINKLKANPSDISILTNYTDMMTEMAEWTSKTEEIGKELENASTTELAEYSAELARLVAKLAKAAY